MKRYWIEGAYAPKGKGKKQLEPFAQLFWAESQEEALRMANEALNGGEWRDGPRISQKSEEQRMRSMGAPELPGFSGKVKKK